MKRSVFALSLLAACSTPPPTASVRATLLEGQIAYPNTGAHAVSVYEFAGAKKGELLCQAQSDAEGRWSCDLGPLGGDVLVEAALDEPLQSIVQARDGAPTQVLISAWTHLQAAYAQAKTDEGLELEQALLKSRALLSEHLGGVLHHLVLPHDFQQGEPPVRLSEEVISAVLLDALEHLGRQLEQRDGLPRGRITANKLLAQLYADLRADALLDGKDQSGPIFIESYQLSSQTLRRDYALALLDYADSEHDNTAFTSVDLSLLAAQIAGNDSELFPSDEPPGSLDITGPEITTLIAEDSEGQPLDLSFPLKDSFWVRLEAFDLSGIESARLSIEGQGNTIAGPFMDRQAFRWRIPAEGLPDGVYEAVVLVTDTLSNERTQALSFELDTTAPELLAMAAGVVSTVTTEVSGTVGGERAPVRIEVRQGAALLATIEDVEEDFSQTVNIDCTSEARLTVSAMDRAGNSSEVELDVLCDTSAPTIVQLQSQYIPENQLDVSFDGQALSYQTPPDVVPQELSGQLFLLRKFFTRLEAGSDNAAVLRFLIEDDNTFTAQYRYLLQGQEVRGLADLPMGAKGFELPLNLQTLGPELLAHSSGVQHQVEIVATDIAGHTTTQSVTFHVRVLSPPVFVINCALDAGLAQYNLPQQTLHLLYQSASVALSETQLIYPLDLAPGALAPRDGVQFEVIEEGAQSRVTSIYEDKHLGPTTPAVAPTENCFVGQYRFWEGLTGAPSPCRQGLYPEEQQLLSSLDGPINDVLPHALQRAVYRSGQPIALDMASNSYAIDSGEVIQIETELDAPSLSIFGQPYDWSTQLLLPSMFVPRPGASRYRFGGTTVPYHFGIEVLTFQQQVDGEPRKFETRAYLQGLDLEVTPLRLRAEHRTMPHIEVPIVYQAAACQQPLSYSTTL